MLGKIGRSWGMAGFSGCLWEMSWGRANVNTGEGEEKDTPNPPFGFLHLSGTRRRRLDKRLETSINKPVVSGFGVVSFLLLQGNINTIRMNEDCDVDELNLSIM
ncbi:hypothetical protein RUM44_009315 [Polyplax serrata]|uniref:Uncharacterized protein n=1 Tax=Polyplax serrata TaxID=468196 RepID=A0ABR1ASL0_POLSC